MSENERKPLNLAICIPGEQFPNVWVSNWTTFLAQLIMDPDYAYNVQFYLGYSSNVYATRSTIWNGVMKGQGGVVADYILWMDDDNLLTFDQFKILLNDMFDDPMLDMVSAWCYCQPDGYDIHAVPSCGYRSSEDGIRCKPIRVTALLGQIPISVDWTGFPAVLMRSRIGRMAGDRPFRPIVDGRTEMGFLGEDISFCYRAKDGGAVIKVDPRLEIVHLKVRAVAPGMRSVAHLPCKGEEDQNATDVVEARQ